MEYPVPCECGKTHMVRAGDAGTSFQCDCRRTVLVRGYHELRQSVGQVTGAPELVIHRMLAEGQLPTSSDCAKCGMPTEGTFLCDIECERPHVRGKEPFWQQAFLFLTLGWFYVIFFRGRQRAGGPELVGKHVAFILPMRCCPDCMKRLRPREAAELLSREPAYAALLAKYPHAEIQPAAIKA